jgi:hypothetical protein
MARYALTHAAVAGCRLLLLPVLALLRRQLINMSSRQQLEVLTHRVTSLELPYVQSEIST